MSPLRFTDRILLLVLAPVLAVAAYVYFFALDATRENAALRAEADGLVEASEFNALRAAAERRKNEAEAQATAAETAPKTGVVIDETRDAATRQRALIEALTARGIRVLSVNGATFRIAANFSMLANALDAFDNENIPAIASNLRQTETQHQWLVEFAY